MGGACCLEKDLNSKELKGENKVDMIEYKIKEIKNINNYLILNSNDITDEEYLNYIIKINELIFFIKEEIELLEQDEIKRTHFFNEIQIIENNLISEINEKIIIISNKSENLFNQALKEKNNAIEKFKSYESHKIESINFIKNINNDNFEKFLNQKNPSKKELLIIKLIFLIINPEGKAQIPGLIIKKDLETMENECFKKGIVKIKKIMIERLNDISWLTSEFLEDNKIFMKYPYNDLKEMENISELYKNLFGYFNSLINCKELYDIYKPLMKKSEQNSIRANNLIKIKEKLEKNKKKLLNVNINIEGVNIQ